MAVYQLWPYSMVKAHQVTQQLQARRVALKQMNVVCPLDG